jgi:signal transduction histidine kinase
MTATLASTKTLVLTLLSASTQRLIEDVLDISKMSKGLIELELAVCNVHDVIRPVLQLFSSRANARGISVEYDTDAPEPLYIETDRVRLNQIVVNLVSNSLKFSDDGKIVIRTSLQGDPTESTRMLTLSVSDDGIGLHGEDFERLFRLFEQGSAGLKRGGTGLGLAICHQIVVLLGGSITAHPYVKHGAFP